MNTLRLIKCLALSSVALLGTAPLAQACQTPCHKPQFQVPVLRTYTFLGEKAERSKQNPMVLDDRGNWVRISPNCWQQVSVRVSSDGHWFWRSGPTGDIKKTRIRAGDSVTTLQIYWNVSDKGRVHFRAWGYKRSSSVGCFIGASGGEFGPRPTRPVPQVPGPWKRR